MLGLLAVLVVAVPEHASAHHKDRLLAPVDVCPKQRDRSLPRWHQEWVMRCMHNYARKKRGRYPVRNVSSLWWAARRKAAEIQECQQFSHTPCGRDFRFWLRRTNFTYGCYAVNENIAFGTGRRGRARPIMSGWLHSDRHRRALLGRRHRSFGIGMVRGAFGGHRKAQVWVGYFGYRC